MGAKGARNEEGGQTGAVYLYSLSTLISSQSDNTTPEPFKILYGQNEDDEFGNAVALSSDGSYLVVGSRAEAAVTGAMRVYSITDDVELMKITGENPGDRAGWSVAISGDGSVVAMGATKGGPIGGGVIMAYRAPNWIQYGTPIYGLKVADVSGYSLALSHDGKHMAVGSVKGARSADLRHSGRVDVYDMDGDGGAQSNGWIVRQTLHGGVKNLQYGSSLALSADGSLLVIGANGHNSGTRTKVGLCAIFQWKETEYELLHTLIGSTNQEELGSSAAVSNDGNIVACGGVAGRWGESVAASSGIVRLWKRSTSREMIIWPKGNDASIVDDGSFGAAVSLSADGKFIAIGASSWSGTQNNKPGSVHLIDTGL